MLGVGSAAAVTKQHQLSLVLKRLGNNLSGYLNLISLADHELCHYAVEFFKPGANLFIHCSLFHRLIVFTAALFPFG